jgi:hypothetical protein
MKNLLLIITMLMFAVGCKKKENIYYLSDEVKRNFFFKPGSYWIYRDSISGMMDSCYLSSSMIQILDNPRVTASYSKLELLSLDFLISPLDTSIKDKNELYMGVVENNLLADYIFKLDRNHIQRLVHGTPLPISAPDSKKFGKKDSVNILNKYTVLGVDYENVGEIWVNNHEQHYINDSVGFIKMKVFNDSVNFVWELQRYKIIK